MHQAFFISLLVLRIHSLKFRRFLIQSSPNSILLGSRFLSFSYCLVKNNSSRPCSSRSCSSLSLSFRIPLFHWWRVRNWFEASTKGEEFENPRFVPLLIAKSKCFSVISKTILILQSSGLAPRSFYIVRTSDP